MLTVGVEFISTVAAPALLVVRPVRTVHVFFRKLFVPVVWPWRLLAGTGCRRIGAFGVARWQALRLQIALGPGVVGCSRQCEQPARFKSILRDALTGEVSAGKFSLGHCKSGV